VLLDIDNSAHETHFLHYIDYAYLLVGTLGLLGALDVDSKIMASQQDRYVGFINTQYQDIRARLIIVTTQYCDTTHNANTAVCDIDLKQLNAVTPDKSAYRKILRDLTNAATILPNDQLELLRIGNIEAQLNVVEGVENQTSFASKLLNFLSTSRGLFYSLLAAALGLRVTKVSLELARRVRQRRLESVAP